jgi:hypothetical protein
VGYAYILKVCNCIGLIRVFWIVLFCGWENNGFENVKCTVELWILFIMCDTNVGHCSLFDVRHSWFHFMTSMYCRPHHP